MESNKGSIRIFKLDEYIYPKFRGKIINLYLHAFTTGEYAQYIAPERAESTLDELVRSGFGKMAFIDDRLVGVLLCHLLSYDKEFPADDFPHIPVAKSIYISEVMVHTDDRGKGIALKMISDLLMSLPETFRDVVIRVWEKNEPALSLYRKLGFEPFYSITQTKLRSPEETFVMKKIYLHKALITGARREE
ncbi:MAG: GNAT family N-acetyltransferase [Bacteroidales bacterium]|jgi:ribosomal protein S18 acetylase RimI-like enzyme|nr:GNAT family N-acetyltransferase [Bacteroidales bacterium]